MKNSSYYYCDDCDEAPPITNKEELLEALDQLLASNIRKGAVCAIAGSEAPTAVDGSAAQ